ncbi:MULTISPECIES: catecholate siderophore receptor Fiu [Klebsiella]|uniref:Putative TonB-dependent iron outer membrane transporter n=1 Tax=Klebsiella grimontii TaxID=2058152 RepID=A0A285B1H5_9ENTR|nr:MULTISPECIES: catecholate siderophore receptor Fiu [Klebsiella]OQR50551.1 catecholate siderophore receptor Fiu [Klebsiella oxytoca]KAA0490987.1 catecholate siderophore receptor Fiu [Klebsiella grimontii]MBZ7214092.1 catecholate siderophore receptor Fiu [Klebsiella grimontii]PEN23054.1 TonB-dependent siderophore receptor [Klebsiella sp. MBT K-1]PMT96161.1 catecholate siderophore receptor Fiu [Klebsiella sp. Kd70 TUC-EEAOC]
MEKNNNLPFSSFNSLTLFTGLCLSLSPSGQLLAADSTENTSGETLVVEAQTPSLYAPTRSADPKFSRPIADTTRTVTVVSEQVMKDQGVTNLTDALKNVPGVGAFFAGENGNSTTGDAIYMRGADTSNSIYVDGIRDIGSVSRDTFNTEQVEVIKGPSGSDYGRSAPTGSINMISKQPRLDSGIDASASAGSAWFRRGTLDINQAIGETSAVRLNLMGEKTHDAGRDKVKNERYGVAPSAAFGLGTENRLYLNYLHVTQHNTPDGGIPTIGLPGYSAPNAGTSALNHSGKVATSNFYGTDSDYDDSTTDTVTMRFEHDLSDTTTIRNTTRWSRVKQDYLMTAVMGGASNISQPNPDDVGTWTWSRLANTKDISNKILTNQTNLTSTFYTGAIGHDVSTGVEFTRETQTNYGVYPLTPPAVNIYHPNSDISIGGLNRSGANANGQTDTFGVYAFDTLQISQDFELNGGIRLDNYQTKYDSASLCGGTGRGAIACPTGVAKNTPLTTVDTSTSGNLVNWKAGALYHLTDNGNLYVNYAVSQQPPGGSNFTLAQSGTGSSANRTDFKPQKAKTSELGTKWELMDKRLLLTAALFRTDIENEVEQNDDGSYSQYGKKRVEGYEISLAGNITPDWQVIGGYTQQHASVREGANTAQDGTSALPYTPEHAFTLWSQYQATDAIAVGAGARYVGSMHRGSDGAVGTPSYTEGYWVADAKVGYRINRNLDLQLNVYNLFDTDYVASINKSGYRYHPGEPRTFLLTANIHF